jgi:RNA polymerase sigma factor (sigma-70 family)
MAPERHGSVVRPLQMLFADGTACGLTDAELLERFATSNTECSEFAFAALVERHLPMVLRVCGAILRDAHASEDASQAVFLVLARRARSLHPGTTLAPWLQQVAWRTASSLRGRAAHRRRHEHLAAVEAPLAERNDDWEPDLGEVLHEELTRLPARYRVPVVLCYTLNLA